MPNLTKREHKDYQRSKRSGKLQLQSVQFAGIGSIFIRNKAGPRGPDDRCWKR
jgi:hypothetical protein